MANGRSKANDGHLLDKNCFSRSAIVIRALWFDGLMTAFGRSTTRSPRSIYCHSTASLDLAPMTNPLTLLLTTTTEVLPASLFPDLPLQIYLPGDGECFRPSLAVCTQPRTPPQSALRITYARPTRVLYLVRLPSTSKVPTAWPHDRDGISSHALVPSRYRADKVETALAKEATQPDTNSHRSDLRRSACKARVFFRKQASPAIISRPRVPWPPYYLLARYGHLPSQGALQHRSVIGRSKPIVYI